MEYLPPRIEEKAEEYVYSIIYSFLPFQPKY